MLGKRKKLVIGLNLILLLYLLHFFLPLGGLLLSIVINLMVFIVPGAAWRGIWKRKVQDPVEEIILILVASTVILLVGVLGHFGLGLEISAKSQFLYLTVITNLGLILVKSPPKNDSRHTTRVSQRYLCVVRCETCDIPLLPLLILGLIYIFIYLGATRVVPALPDHDMETQGTAWSLLHRLKPLHLTDRGTTYFFAHPLLFHFYNAHTILFSDALDELRWYEEDVAVGEKILNTKLPEGTEVSFITGDGRKIKRQVSGIDNEKIILNKGAPGAVSRIVIPDFECPPFEPRQPISKGQTSLNIHKLRYWAICSFVEDKAVPRFKKKPFLLPTRMPNIFFSCLTAFILFHFLKKTTRSRLLAILGPLLYFTFPEIFVRSSAGAYTAITNFGIFALAYFYVHRSSFIVERSTVNFQLPMFLTGIFLGLANHKAVILPVAIAVRELFTRIGKERILKVLKVAALNPAVLGFLFGTLLFWAYGLITSADVFIQEHLRYHLINRIAHITDLGYTGYPSPLELWRGFFYYSPGQPILLLGAVGLIYLLAQGCRSHDAGRRSSVVGRGSWVVGRELALALWFLLGAVAFTIIDWRQTKHLMLLVPALMIGLFSLFQVRRFLKFILYGLVGLSILRNILIIILAWQDFSILYPAGGW